MRAVLAIVTLLLGANAAHAGLEICNKGGAAQTVGLAYKQGKMWFSEGWWTIEPQGCKVLVGGDLQVREYYYTVKNSPNYMGQGNWFCAKDEPYDLTGADGDCGALGANSRDYTLIDTGEAATSFTFDLVMNDAAPIAVDAGGITLPAEAMTESFTRGQQGEPFTITARMQNCTAEDGYSACFVYAEGWRWAFDTSAANNAAAMAAMASLPINTMLYISGDVLNYNDITVDALMAKMEIAPPDANSATLNMMQGRWVSADDAQSFLDIYGSEQTSSYGTEISGTSVLTFPEACPDGGLTDGTTLVLQEMGTAPEDALCYDIFSISPEKMELMYLPRGNILTYTRG